MSVKDLTSEEIEALVGSRHEAVGIAYAAQGMQPYYAWLMRSLHLLAESAAGELRVARHEAGGALVWVAPGRVVLGGQSWAAAEGALDLSTLNNETANIWARVVNDVVVVEAGTIAAGWPGAPHVKLAEVVIEAGVVTSITDRRAEGRLTDAHERFGYRLAIDTQGDISTPSAVMIDLVDAHGDRVAIGDLLRVRVSGTAGPSATTNAAIGVTGDTSIVETITAGKDLVIESDAQGRYELSLTNAQVETAVVRIGAAPVGGRLADWSAALAVSHA